MKKLLFLFVIALMCCIVCQAQTTTTITFKPGSAIGQDAMMRTAYGCVFNGNLVATEYSNYGNATDIIASAWTFNALGCPFGNIRSLLKFSELSTIPPNAEIISAELKLFGMPNLPGLVGNSSFPGAPSSYKSNKSFIQRVTSDWHEQTVTWSTQPTTTTAGQITVPQSTSQWNWNFVDNSANLVAMVQDMVSNPETNFGFMLKLETEATYYRSFFFASSDNADPTLWPQLTVTYRGTPIIIDTIPCEANFNYCVNTATPNVYHFSIIDTIGRHFWSIDGQTQFEAFSFNQTFSDGTHGVCYTKIVGADRCQKCITICVQNGMPALDITSDVVSPKLEVPPHDFISSKQNKVEIYPNPTKDEWNIKLFADKEEMVKVKVLTLNGKVLSTENRMLVEGDNSFVVKANLKSGYYLIHIVGNTVQYSGKLIKE